MSSYKYQFRASLNNSHLSTNTHLVWAAYRLPALTVLARRVYLFFAFFRGPRWLARSKGARLALTLARTFETEKGLLAPSQVIVFCLSVLLLAVRHGSQASALNMIQTQPHRHHPQTHVGGRLQRKPASIFPSPKPPKSISEATSTYI